MKTSSFLSSTSSSEQSPSIHDYSFSALPGFFESSKHHKKTPPTHRCVGGVFFEFFSHFILMRIQRAYLLIIVLYHFIQRSKKVYESKGHRFESCWVHHEPPTSFALLAVFLSAFGQVFSKLLSKLSLSITIIRKRRAL